MTCQSDGCERCLLLEPKGKGKSKFLTNAIIGNLKKTWPGRLKKLIQSLNPDQVARLRLKVTGEDILVDGKKYGRIPLVEKRRSQWLLKN